ncbi:MAG: hypothetical protein ACYCW6_19890 [Candidatus Xenobia bacterium]
MLTTMLSRAQVLIAIEAGTERAEYWWPNLRESHSGETMPEAAGRLEPEEELVGVWSHPEWQPDRIYATTVGMRFALDGVPYVLRYANVCSVLFPWDKTCNLYRMRSVDYEREFVIPAELFHLLDKCCKQLRAAFGPGATKMTWGTWGRPADRDERAFDETESVMTRQGARMDRLRREGRWFSPNPPEIL